MQFHLLPSLYRNHFIYAHRWFHIKHLQMCMLQELRVINILVLNRNGLKNFQAVALLLHTTDFMRLLPGLVHLLCCDNLWCCIHPSLNDLRHLLLELVIGVDYWRGSFLQWGAVVNKVGLVLRRVHFVKVDKVYL